MMREFAAPRQRLFDAFTRPELLRRWIGREGDKMTACEVDLRVGGTYRYEWRLRDDTTFGETGTFRELVPPERIVAVETFGEYAGETLVSTTFAELVRGTTVTTTCVFVSQEIRDAVLASGVASGAGESYARLDVLLRMLPGREPTP
jgi:uncharacterized protein YndB with AHSA1/START domain